MKRFQILNGLLVLLIVFALWQTVGVIRRSAPVIAAREVTERRVPPASSGRRRPPAEMASAIANGDLFDVSRSAAQEGALTDQPVAAAPPAPPPNLKLAGVIEVGSMREALVMDAAAGNKQQRVRAGEEITGWRVSAIEPESVALQGAAGEQVILQLEISSAVQAGLALGLGGRMPPPPPAKPGVAIGQRPPPPGGVEDVVARVAIEKRREDARQRAQRARERLKQLRDEAARRQQQ